MNYKEIYSETSSVNLSIYIYISSSAVCYSYIDNNDQFDSLNPKFLSDVKKFAN